MTQKWALIGKYQKEGVWTAHLLICNIVMVKVGIHNGNANRKVFSELSLRNWIELLLKSSFFIGYFTLSLGISGYLSVKWKILHFFAPWVPMWNFQKLIRILANLLKFENWRNFLIGTCLKCPVMSGYTWNWKYWLIPTISGNTQYFGLPVTSEFSKLIWIRYRKNVG